MSVANGSKEQQAIFRNTHDAIVEEAVFERVQELRKNKRRPTKAERQGLFSGLLFCPDCGNKLHFATCKNFNGSQDHYRCARYKSNTGDCTAHFIREEVLRKIVLNRIFAVTAMFYEDITAFMELIQKQRFDEAEKDMKRKRREVGQARKRIAELDRIFKRIYEDDINGTLFMDPRTDLVQRSTNIIIYGHNMKNGSMFGHLKKFTEDEKLYNNDRYFWILTPDKNYRYEIISAYTTGVNSDTYTLFKGPGEEFEEYLKKIKSYSDIKTEDTELTIKDKIVTLSTCTGNESTRFVVQGKRVNAEDDGSGENAGSANSDAASVDSVTVQEG